MPPKRRLHAVRRTTAAAASRAPRPKQAGKRKPVSKEEEEHQRDSILQLSMAKASTPAAKERRIARAQRHLSELRGGAGGEASPTQRAASSSSSSPAAKPRRATNTTSSLVSVHFSRREDLVRMCRVTTGLLLAVRTSAAQLRDTTGHVAANAGVVCSDRLVECAERISGISVLPSDAYRAAAVFPEVLEVVGGWEERAQGPFHEEEIRKKPRLRILCTSIPSVEELVEATLRRHGSLTAVSHFATARLRTDAVAASSSALSALPDSAPGLSRRPPALPPAGKPFANAGPASSSAALPAEVHELLAPAARDALLASVARTADLQLGLQRTAEDAIVEGAVLYYDRVRAYLGPKANVASFDRLVHALRHLTCDVRPVEVEVAERRLHILLSFGPATTGLTATVGPPVSGVSISVGSGAIVKLNRGQASRSRLQVAVEERLAEPPMSKREVIQP